MGGGERAQRKAVIIVGGGRNHVDGEDPWLMMVEEGRSCSTRPEATRAVKRKSPRHTAPPGLWVL